MYKVSGEGEGREVSCILHLSKPKTKICCEGPFSFCKASLNQKELLQNVFMKMFQMPPDSALRVFLLETRVRIKDSSHLQNCPFHMSTHRGGMMLDRNIHDKA